MPRYISLHTLACLTRQGAEHLTTRLAATDRVTTRRVQVNMIEGKMLVEFESPDRDTLEKWFRDEGFHYDWVLRKVPGNSWVVGRSFSSDMRR
jgi:hypothetical protein